MANRGKPGELALACGLSCLFIGPLVLAIVQQQDGQLASLQQQGVVAAAAVTGHDQRQEQYDGRGGRPRIRTSYYLDLRYDLNAATPYQQWQANGQIASSQWLAQVSQQIDVGEAIQQAHPVGTTAPVVFVPGQSDSLMLVAEVQQRTSWTYHLWHYLAMGAVMLAGLWLTVTGWRQRFPRSGAGA